MKTNKVVQEPSREGIRSAAPVGGEETKSVGSETSLFSGLKLLQKKKLSSIEIFFFGAMVAMGAQNAGWNAAYSGGFWNAFSSVLVAGLGYLCLCLCLAEMISALPFSGGIYGFVRATAGPFAGYLVACFELLMNITYMVSGFSSLTNMFGQTGSVSALFLCFGTALAICLVGGKVYWSLTNVLTVAMLVLLLVYLFGSIHDLDLQTYGDLHQPLTMTHFITSLEGSNSQYTGIQYLPLLANLCPDPRKKMPWLMIAVPVASILTALWLVVMVAGHAPGAAALATADYPMSQGYGVILGITNDAAKWLNFPGLYAAFLGFIFAYGRQLQTISTTGLLPVIFQQTVPHLATPYIALLTGTVISLVLSIICVYCPVLMPRMEHISNASTNIVFFGACASYILFKQNFSLLQRDYVNPFGISAAIVGMIIFLLNIISSCSFQGQIQQKMFITLIAVVVYFIFSVLFYIFYMAKNQTFSEEEKQKMFKAYLVNANKAKRERMLRNQKNQQRQSVSKSNSGGNNKSQSNNNNNNNNQTKTDPGKKKKHNSVLPFESITKAITGSRKEETHTGAVTSTLGLQKEEVLPDPEVFAGEDLENQLNQLTNEVQKEEEEDDDEEEAHPHATRHEGRDLALSGKSVMSAMSANSKLSEYQEMAILAAGGLLEDDQLSPALPVSQSLLSQAKATVQFPHF